jgi:hypothetical protein
MLISNKKTTGIVFNICYFVKKKEGKLPLISYSMIHFSLTHYSLEYYSLLPKFYNMYNFLHPSKTNQPKLFIIYRIVIIFHLMTKELLY